MGSGLIYGMFAFFVVVGILLGLKRGLLKSTIRIITVIISCVAVVFLVPPLTRTILNADLSSSGLVIGDVPVTTINDTIINYISQLAGVGPLLASSPTLVALINEIPAILINLILFILIFFVLKGLLYFIDIILNRIIIRKDENKPVRRIWGAVVGGVQGLICFLFILIPIAGTMNLATETMEIVNGETVKVQTVSVANAKDLSSNEGGTGSSKELKKTAQNSIEEYNDIFLIKALNTIGYRWVTNVVYDKITTMEISETEKTTLRNETKVLAGVINSYDKLKNVKLESFNEQNKSDANELIDRAFESPVIGGITTELISGLANTWTAVNPTEFAGVEKPILDEELIECFDALLINLRNDTKDDLKADLKVVVSTLKVSADYGLTASIKLGDADLVVSSLGQEGCMEDIIETLISGRATKQILPCVVEYGISYGYEAIGIDNTEIEITKSANQVNWETEKVILGDLFEGLATTYQSTKGEGEMLNKVDLVGMAKVLESVRASELLGDSSQDITIKLLSSDLLVGVDVSSLITDVADDEKYAEMNFTVMLTTLKSSANIATDIDKISKGEKDSLNPEDVGNLIDGLTTGGATQDSLRNLASSENLIESGVDEATAGAVNGLVESISGYDTTANNSEPKPETEEELSAATDAVENILGASKTAFNSQTNYVFSDNEETAKESMKDLIESMLNSPFIYATTIDNGEKLGFKEVDRTSDPEVETSKLSTYEQEWLVEVLREEKSTNQNCTTDKCEEIAKMFAVEYTE